MMLIKVVTELTYDVNKGCHRINFLKDFFSKIPPVISPPSTFSSEEKENYVDDELAGGILRSNSQR